MLISGRKLGVLISFATVIIITVVTIVMLSQPDGTSNVFRLYIGSGETEQSLDDGKAKVAEICIQNDISYTITEGQGGYRAGDKVLSEKSIVLTLIGIDKETAKKLAAEILPALGQNEIYIEYDTPKFITVKAE